MMGLTPFFRHFGALESLEDRLSRHPDALAGARRVIYRARHAALYASEWARARHDIEVEEVMIAALLHDLAEMLVWCFAPELAQRIDERLRGDPALRSADVQREVMGFPLLDLQLRLSREWNLPSLLANLMDDAHADNPRVTTVALALRLARHSAAGWYNAALPDDYAAVQRLLGMPAPQVVRSVRKVALAAARDWRWYESMPAAALLPLLPDEPPAAAHPAPPAP
jgi:hypothetical protein